MKHVAENKYREFGSNTDGATLVELAIVIPTLLLLVLGAIEFGRFGYNEVLAQKATDLAARTAAVRPAICAGVPNEYEPVIVTGSTTPPRFGTLCRVGGVCQPVPEYSCTLASPDNSNTQAVAAADEIWTTIAPLLPNGATRTNVQIRYTSDPRIGFLGGPYRPIVTAELVGLQFQMVTPLGTLASLATSNGDSAIANSIAFPNMSASLPAEDLGQGLGIQ